MSKMTKHIVSKTPVQRRQVKGGGIKLVVSGGSGLWNVRIRYSDGSEKLVSDDFLYTLAQAGSVASAYFED